MKRLSCRAVILFAVFALFAGILSPAVSVNTDLSDADSGGPAAEISARVVTWDNPVTMRFSIYMADRTEEITSLRSVLVPAGTLVAADADPDDIPGVTVHTPISSRWVEYRISMRMNEDVNLYVFINDHPPVTDGRTHRAYERVLHMEAGWTMVEVRSFPGLEPHFDYAVLNGRFSPDSFEFIIFSHLPGQTQMRLAKPDGSGTVPLTQEPAAGINTFAIPGGLRGTYLLSLTKDGGDTWQRLCYLRMFDGKAPWGPVQFTIPGRLSIDFSEEEAAEVRKISAGGELQLMTMVEFEDFELPVTLTLTDTEKNVAARTISAFDNDGVNASMDFRRFFTAVYTFRTPLADLDDGVYMATIARGEERMDYFKFEKFKGAYYALNIDELPVRPLEEGHGEGQYLRIWLSGEQIHTGNAVSGFFSINGGTKWEPISRYNANNFSRWLDRGITELWFSDINPADENAKFIKFPAIAQRAPAPRLEVNYRLAHMVDGELVYDGDNRWVAVIRGTQTPLGPEWSYLTADNFGRPDRALGSFRMSPAGIPIPECDERENENSGMLSHRGVRENYFIYRAPFRENGVFHPPTKPARVRVSCYGRPRAAKINYKTETMRAPNGIVFHEGFEQLVITGGVISVTGLIDYVSSDSYWYLGLGREYAWLEYSIGPTDKRPASGIVWHTVAERRECIEEDTPSEREVRPSVLNVNGRFRPAKGLEFRAAGTGKWGSFKQPSDGSAQIEFRFKANARSGRMFYEGDREWHIDDGVIWRRTEGELEEYERYAAGVPQLFVYEWGALANGKAGITRVISDVGICCPAGCGQECR